MESQLKELLQFLHDKNPQVRQIALTNLLGHTPKDSLHRSIFFTGLGGGGLKKETENDYIRDLKILCRDQLAIAQFAFRALVNLSDSPILSSYLSEPAYLDFLVSYIIHPPSELADLAAMTLSNITVQASTCAALLNLKVAIIPNSDASPPFYPPSSRAATSLPPSPYPSEGIKKVEALPLLIQAFALGAEVAGEKTRKCSLHHLASVFANVSTAPAGRLFFLTPRPRNVLSVDSDQELEYLLAQVAIFTNHTDETRRAGVTSTIKHCAFYIPAHKAILSSDSDSVSVPPSRLIAPGINSLPNILFPLAGPEEFDLEDQEKLPVELQLLPETKKREPDDMLRRTHVETLILLCTTRAGREHLRNNGAYEIVRAAHLVETVEEISVEMERLVNLLKGEEAPLHDVEDDGWSHPLLEESLSDVGARTDEPFAADTELTSSLVGSLFDDEGDDDRIVEV